MEYQILKLPLKDFVFDPLSNSSIAKIFSSYVFSTRFDVDITSEQLPTNTSKRNGALNDGVFMYVSVVVVVLGRR